MKGYNDITKGVLDGSYLDEEPIHSYDNYSMPTLLRQTTDLSSMIKFNKSFNTSEILQTDSKIIQLINSLNKLLTLIQLEGLSETQKQNIHDLYHSIQSTFINIDVMIKQKYSEP